MALNGLTSDDLRMVGCDLEPDVLSGARVLRDGCPLPLSGRGFDVLKDVDAAVHPFALLVMQTALIKVRLLANSTFV